MPNGFSFNSYCYFWSTQKHTSFITKLLWNWPGDQKQIGAFRQWATISNIPAGKLHLGDYLSPWPVLSSAFLTDGCRFCRANVLCYVSHKLHPSAVNSRVTYPRLSMVEILLVFLFLTQLLCPETKTDSLLSGRGHLQHAGSFPGERKSVETKWIKALLLYISQYWNRSGEEAGRQSLFSESFQSTLMCTCQISYFSRYTTVPACSRSLIWLFIWNFSGTEQVS